MNSYSLVLRPYLYFYFCAFFFHLVDDVFIPKRCQFFKPKNWNLTDDFSIKVFFYFFSLYGIGREKLKFKKLISLENYKETKMRKQKFPNFSYQWKYRFWDLLNLKKWFLDWYLFVCVNVYIAVYYSTVRFFFYNLRYRQKSKFSIFNSSLNPIRDFLKTILRSLFTFCMYHLFLMLFDVDVCYI